MKKLTTIISVLLIGFITASCGQGDGKGKKKNKKDKETSDSEATSNPPGYDLTAPQEYKMPIELLEISGIALNNGDNKTFYAQQDEDGSIYQFKLGDKGAKDATFAGPGDYEDLAIGNNYAIVLRSDGQLHSFPISEIANGRIRSQKIKHLMPKAEYEGMEFDPDTKKLYVLCKQCDIDKGTDNNSGYSFTLGNDGEVTKSGEFKVVVEDPEGKKKFKLRPSAMAKNPLTKQWFILSSINKMLVVTDDKFAVQATYKLKGFLQPEGMAFDTAGNLYISNEGDELSSGDILMFKYNGTKK